MALLEGVEVQSHTRAARPNIGLKLLGAPWLAVGLLILGALVRDTAEAILAGVPMGPGALLADLAVRSLVTYVVLGLGLLMVFGDVYVRLDVAARRVRSLQFYGLFYRTMEATFDDAVQVVVRARSSRPSSASLRRSDGNQRYYTSYRLELELRDGRRMPLGSGLDKRRVHARAAQLGGRLGVPVLDLGLVGER